MENLTIYEIFRKVPKEAQKTIKGGRLTGFTDINPMWRIKMLTEKFGICGFGWKYEITSQEIKDGANGEKVAFVNILLFIKINEEWSAPIPGLGGSSFVANEKNGAYTSDECFKMALTDAISIACKALGMGADIYFDQDKSKYNKIENTPEPIKPEPLKFDSIETKKILKTFKTSEEVAKYWRENKHLQSNQEYVFLISERGKELKNIESNKNENGTGTE